MSYILSLPDNWTICMTHLNGRFGRPVVAGCLLKLKDLGYLSHSIERDAKTNRILAHRWTAYDDPSENKPHCLEIQRLEIPEAGKQTTTKEIGNKGNTETKEIEHKNTGGPSARCASFSDSKPKNGKPLIPLWPDVEAYAKREGIAIASALRFFKLNEFKGWITKNGPIRCWKRALVGFVEAEPANAQKLEKPDVEEFKKWAYATFDEDDMDHVRAFAACYDKRVGKKRNRMTGEMEPISDIKAACRAFVESCNDKGILR